MRLVDRFVAELRARRGPLLFEIRVGGFFVELMWLPVDEGNVRNVFPLDDPMFKVVGRTRCVALGTIVGEIHFYAGPNDEDEATEIGSFESVADAVAFAVAYLSGTPLDAIDTPRRVNGL